MSKTVIDSHKDLSRFKMTVFDKKCTNVWSKIRASRVWLLSVCLLFIEFTHKGTLLWVLLMGDKNKVIQVTQNLMSLLICFVHHLSECSCNRGTWQSYSWWPYLQIYQHNIRWFTWEYIVTHWWKYKFKLNYLKCLISLTVSPTWSWSWSWEAIALKKSSDLREIWWARFTSVMSR